MEVTMYPKAETEGSQLIDELLDLIYKAYDGGGHFLGEALEKVKQNSAPIIEALGKIGAAAIPDLMYELTNERVIFRARRWRFTYDGELFYNACAQALGGIGPPAVSTLFAAYHDANYSQSKQIIVKALGYAHATKQVIQLLEEELMKEKPSIGHLTKILQRKKDDRIVNKLDDRIVNRLIDLLKHEDQEIIQIAAEALGNMREVRAVESLIPLLKHREDFVHREAVIALGKIGDRRAIEPLIVSLNSSHSHVAHQAAIALGKIGDVRAVEPLIAFMDRTYERKWLVGIAEALVRIGDGRAVAPLEHKLLLGNFQEDSKRISEAVTSLKEKLAWGKNVVDQHLE
jgi:hypothetical protein